MSHFTAAAVLAAAEFDGSVVGTIASALLLPLSSHSWHALRSRDLSPGQGGLQMSIFGITRIYFRPDLSPLFDPIP